VALGPEVQVLDLARYWFAVESGGLADGVQKGAALRAPVEVLRCLDVASTSAFSSSVSLRPDLIADPTISWAAASARVRSVFVLNFIGCSFRERRGLDAGRRPCLRLERASGP
jgi:hypothetical protein